MCSLSFVYFHEIHKSLIPSKSDKFRIYGQKFIDVSKFIVASTVQIVNKLKKTRYIFIKHKVEGTAKCGINQKK